MTTKNARKQKAYRDRKKVKQDAMLEERRELFVLFCHAFPGAFTVNVQPALEADPDLKDPIRVRLKFDEKLRPVLVKFAHIKGLDIEELFDMLTEEVVERMRRRKMIPDVVRHLVE